MNTYSFRLGGAQYLAAVQYKASRSASYLVRAASFVATVLLFASFGALATAGYMSRTLPGKPVMGGALLGLIALVALAVIYRSAHSNLIRGSTYKVGREHTFTIMDDGIEMKSDVANETHPWSAFESVEERAGLVYLHLDNVHFHPIPVSAFGSDAAKDEFLAYAAARIASASDGVHRRTTLPAIEVHESRPQPQTASRMSPWRRLRDAVRLAFLLDVPRERLDASWGLIAAIALAGALIPSLPTFLSEPLAGGWNWFALPGVAFHLPLILLAAAVLASATRDREDVSRVFLAGCLAAIVIDVLAIAASFAIGSLAPKWRAVAWSGIWVPGAWLGLAVATFAGRQVPKSGRRLGVVVASILLVSVPLSESYRDRSVWHRPYDADSMRNFKEGGVAGEDAFYKQASLLDQELDAIRPGKHGVIDVYFVGMAGYGMQDVFMREVNSVANLFRDRFAAEGRTVRLINNPKTLLDTPIASKTSLRKALGRIASTMDKEEDVLVLFMTSHGNENQFSLELWPMAFHDIDPSGLREMLDESGIRNRVIILSACYSGAS